VKANTLGQQLRCWQELHLPTNLNLPLRAIAAAHTRNEQESDLCIPARLSTYCRSRIGLCDHRPAISDLEFNKLSNLEAQNADELFFEAF
jgi:hypothetical protein